MMIFSIIQTIKSYSNLLFLNREALYALRGIDTLNKRYQQLILIFIVTSREEKQKSGWMMVRKPSKLRIKPIKTYSQELNISPSLFTRE